MRDAILPILAILAASQEARCRISTLRANLPVRTTYSDRLKNFPTEISRSHLAEFIHNDQQKDLSKVNDFLGGEFAPASHIDSSDGTRITLQSDEVVHIRPSGNAPELRCYTESDSAQNAQALNNRAMERIVFWRG